jgi:hypothetical protein
MRRRLLEEDDPGAAFEDEDRVEEEDEDEGEDEDDQPTQRPVRLARKSLQENMDTTYQEEEEEEDDEDEEFVKTSQQHQ